MRILLDESLPRKLGFSLSGHHVRTVQHMGWNGLVNGKLLSAATGQFDVLVTGDQNMQYQQNADQLPLSVVVLIAPNNKLESFLPMMPRLVQTLARLEKPTFVVLES
jgi:predicted nuclease of predicted toxin-antitoxin system